jgi:hypothetical protein
MEKNPFERETSLFGFDGNEFFIPNMHSCIGEDLRRQEIRLGKDILLTSTETLSKRFDPKVGSIRSYDFGEWQFLVIIDNKHDEFGNIF